MGADVLVLVTCTNRKTISPASALTLRAVRGRTVALRARSWVSRLKKNTSERHPAKDLYAGDHWSVARSIEEKATRAGRPVSLWVCSAGYGLIPCNAPISSYAATFASNLPDSVARAEDNGHAAEARREWWNSLAKWEGPALESPRTIHELVSEHKNSTLLVAASAQYLEAMTEDLEQAASVLGRDRLAIFCAGSPPATLDPYHVPCDARLQTPLGGALSSLNVRCVRHALENAHGERLCLTALRALFLRLLRKQPERAAQGRRPLSDDDVCVFIRESLKEDSTARPTPLLRRLRESGRACEHSRFGELFRRVEGGRHG